MPTQAPQPTEAHQLLERVIPTTSEGCDYLLDLRDLLMSKGHAGKCVSCFFGLLGDLQKPGALLPLRHWLEQHIEIAVFADDRQIDTLPLKLEADADLDSFCTRAIDTVRHDRAHRAAKLALKLRYKDLV
ncbi:MAG: hypothetical protein R3242_04395 [Akkermansiaceae bacterium]|nr:hypothetical protein [Akkermansiaceae bacterium]